MVTLPRGVDAVNSDSNEEHPSLSDDGRLLAFATGRYGASHYDDVVVYDLVANALVPTPGLSTDGEQGQPFMSGDGSTIVYSTGPDLGRRVAVYDRTAGAMVDLPVLRSGNDVYDPSTNRTG